MYHNDWVFPSMFFHAFFYFMVPIVVERAVSMPTMLSFVALIAATMFTDERNEHPAIWCLFAPLFHSWIVFSSLLRSMRTSKSKVILPDFFSMDVERPADEKSRLVAMKKARK